MTWGEFKEWLDKEVADDEEIRYIDVSRPTVREFERGNVSCTHHETLGVTVKN